MATTTREYLSSVRQESSGGGGRLALPPGPCILSPSRLIESLTREARAHTQSVQERLNACGVCVRAWAWAWAYAC
eukprot:4822512-Pleurochrysis_carterae.AAC.1